MPLYEAHDIGESLQHKLELLTEVDRAHVHLDFEIDHGKCAFRLFGGFFLGGGGGPLAGGKEEGRRG